MPWVAARHEPGGTRPVHQAGTRAERARSRRRARLYERLGLPVIYEGPEYPEFIGFGTETVHFGIQKAAASNDPPSVLTWQIGVTDIDAAMERCRSAGIGFELEHNNPGPGWVYRRLLIRTPSGYRLALESPTNNAADAVDSRPGCNLGCSSHGAVRVQEGPAKDVRSV